MTEPPKNKPSRRISRIFLIWLASFVLIALAARIVLAKTDRVRNEYPDMVWSLVFGVVGASILVCLLAFICWLNSWRNFRRALIGLAILATLVAIFYTEEDWRGKHDWEKCKSRLEAQGFVLDWDKFLPPPVPDDQNFYTFSTNFLEFKQIHTDAEIAALKKISWLHLDPINHSNGSTPLFPAYDTSKSGPIIVAKIIVLRGNENALPAGTNTFIVTLNDAEAADQIRTRIRDFIRTGIGQFISGAQGFNFSEFQLTSLPLAQIFVRASTPPSIGDLNTFCPSDAIAGIGKLKVVATTDPNTFDILVTDMRITAAADYLKWSDQFVPGFNDVREALKRPYAILPGDYSAPYAMPIPNFVLMRALAQTLAQRTQCYLLLGQPDNALHELTLVHDVCRILEKPPTGQPETLVEAMINVAIHGLYVAVISEGLQRHAWQEAQLEALQGQLKEINLPSRVTRAFDSEPAADCRNLGSGGFGVLILSYTRFNATPPWGKIKNLELHCLADFAPRGWVYQNMAAIAMVRTKQLEVFDSENGIVLPSKSEDLRKDQDAMTRHSSPYKFLVADFVPNFTRIWQTTAYNQTMVNEAQIACALERYHLANGQYPDTLDALMPQFIETIPHDIIGGQPLLYRRTDDGKFLLYSVGWNEKDDGGQQEPHRGYPYTDDYSKGDWVWPATASH